MPKMTCASLFFLRRPAFFFFVTTLELALLLFPEQEIGRLFFS